MSEKNYKFDYQVGDIIFIKNAKGIISQGIQIVTGSKFSHAETILSKAKYDEDHRFTITANKSGGVHYNSLNRYINKNISFEVYRWKGGISDEKKAELWDAHKKYHGMDYDTFGAGGSANGWFWNLFPSKKDAMFCSELASQLMKDIGLDPMPGVDSDEINPHELSKSKFLELVHDTDK